MDSLKYISNITGGNVRSQNLLDPNFNKRSLRKAIIKDYKNLDIVIDDYNEVFLISIRISTDWVFSINIPERIFYSDIPLTLDNFPYVIYFPDPKEFSLKEFVRIFMEPFLRKIQEVDLSKNEGVFVYKNGICFVLNNDRLLFERFELIVELVNNNGEIFHKIKKSLSLHKKNLPEKFQFLLPFLKKLDISDDASRQELSEEINGKEKEVIIQRIGPLLGEIDLFLNSFGDKPLSEEASKLGNLAELVRELLLHDD